MKLVVGLGNPGKEYVKNRHNAGSIVLDKVLQDRGLRWEEHKKFQALINITEDTVYAKPLVYMNNSGVTVSSLADFYKIDPEDITVIHDDVDLGMGRVKKQFGGGRSEEHTSELQSHVNLVCRLLLEKINTSIPPCRSAHLRSICTAGACWHGMI